MIVLSKLILTFNAIPIKTPTGFFQEIGNMILRYMEIQGTTDIQGSLEKEESWRTYIFHF